MSIWIRIAIALALFLLGAKAVLRLGFRRYLASMRADFIAYMKARSPHLMLIERPDRIEIRVRGRKVASVAWRLLYKRLSELPRNMPDRRRVAFEIVAVVMEELAAGPKFDPVRDRESLLPRLVLPSFPQQAEASGVQIPPEPFLDSKPALVYTMDRKEDMIFEADLSSSGIQAKANDVRR
jgi:hypothetical protein